MAEDFEKELARRSGLTLDQIRTCLSLAERHGILERRSKGKGRKKGSDLWIRPNFRVLEDMLAKPGDSHKIAKCRPEFYDWPDVEPKGITDHLDGGNSPRPCITYNNSLLIKNKIRKNPPDGESFSISKTEEEENDKIRVGKGPQSTMDDREGFRYANARVHVVIGEEGHIRPACEDESQRIYEVMVSDMEIIAYLQGSDFDLVGFPSAGKR